MKRSSKKAALFAIFALNACQINAVKSLWTLAPPKVQEFGNKVYEVMQSTEPRSYSLNLPIYQGGTAKKFLSRSRPGHTRGAFSDENAIYFPKNSFQENKKITEFQLTQLVHEKTHGHFCHKKEKGSQADENFQRHEREEYDASDLTVRTLCHMGYSRAAHQHLKDIRFKFKKNPLGGARPYFFGCCNGLSKIRKKKQQEPCLLLSRLRKVCDLLFMEKHERIEKYWKTKSYPEYQQWFIKNKHRFK